jgi:hypothetical protein
MTKNVSTTKKSEKQEERRVPASYVGIVNPYCAGIDIGSRSHFVAAPIIAEGVHDICIKEFASFTPDLYALADWLKERKVTSVAMESTGVYWIPAYEILESRGFEVKLVDARHVKNVTGRKTDVIDCQWLQQLHACGLLHGAFRPADAILPLRSYMRQRRTLIASAATAVQRMQKAMTQMNLHLSNVLNDIAGLTGMNIIRAIIVGERDPKKLAQLRDRRCKQPQEVIEKSLTGNYRSEHLFSLQQSLETFDFYQKQILICDQKIEEALKELNPSHVDKPHGLDPKPANPRTYRAKGSNTLHFDPLPHLTDITKVDITKVPGIGANLAVGILSETGMDMGRWKSAKQFASWLGLSPENKVSGGKILSSRTRRSSNKAAEGFRMAACSVQRSQTGLGGFFRRIKSKHGAAKAVTATARKIAVIFYTLLTKGVEYVESGLQQYEENYKERIMKGLQKRAHNLGMVLVPDPSMVRVDIVNA